MRTIVHKPKAAVVAALCLACWLGVTPRAGFASSMICAGGQPSYCARQDWISAYGDPVAGAPSALSGAIGADQMTVSQFGERVVRITDVLAEGPSLPGQALTGFSGDYGGSDEGEPISLNDDFIYVQDNGGNTFVYSFNPVSMVANRLYQASYPTTNGLEIADGGKDFIWSPVQDDVLYEWGMPASDYEIWHWTFSSLVTPPGGSTLDKDLTADSNCNVLPASPVWYSNISVSADGSTFAVSASSGGQDSANIALVWQKSTGKCAWINTQTGAYGGNLGGSGTISGFTAGYIHNLRMFGNPAWLRIDYPSSGGSDTLVWQIGTGNAYICAGNGGPCGGGHLGNGYNLFATGIGANWTNPYLPYLYSVHTQTNPTVNDLLLASAPYSGSSQVDAHVSWQPDNASDNEPLVLTGDGDATNETAWTTEVWALATNFSQAVWRFARTWSLQESFYFNPEHSVGQTSRDGKFSLVATDWGGKFGATSAVNIQSWSRSGNTVTITASSPICGNGTFLSGDTFDIEGAALGSGGTSINGRNYVGTFTTIPAPTSAPALSTSTTGGYIPANTNVTVGVAYYTGSAGGGCYTTIGPTASITTGSSTGTNTVTVNWNATEAGETGWTPFVCTGSGCTYLVSQDDEPEATTSEVLGTYPNNIAHSYGLWVVGCYGGSSGWVDHIPALSVNGANGTTMRFSQAGPNDSSATASGKLLDNTCNAHWSTVSCRYDAVMVELK